LTIDARIVIYGFDVLGIRDLKDIENVGNVVSLRRMLLTVLILVEFKLECGFNSVVSK